MNRSMLVLSGLGLRHAFILRYMLLHGKM